MLPTFVHHHRLFHRLVKLSSQDQRRQEMGRGKLRKSLIGVVIVQIPRIGQGCLELTRTDRGFGSHVEDVGDFAADARVMTRQSVEQLQPFRQVAVGLLVVPVVAHGRPHCVEGGADESRVPECNPRSNASHAWATVGTVNPRGLAHAVATATLATTSRSSSGARPFVWSIRARISWWLSGTVKRAGQRPASAAASACTMAATLLSPAAEARANAFCNRSKAASPRISA